MNDLAMRFLLWIDSFFAEIPEDILVPIPAPTPPEPPGPFVRAFAFTIGHEGGYDNTISDRGNWSSGQCGVGFCRGTKFGVSAAAYPTLDIANLTLDAAQVIYARDYWVPARCDALAPGLALLVFDAAVNNGVIASARLLQAALGVVQDGQIGPRTLAAVAAMPTQALMSEFQAQRLMLMTGLPTWAVFGLGWARRLTALPYEALSMSGAAV